MSLFRSRLCSKSAWPGVCRSFLTPLHIRSLQPGAQPPAPMLSVVPASGSNIGGFPRGDVFQFFSVDPISEPICSSMVAAPPNKLRFNSGNSQVSVSLLKVLCLRVAFVRSVSDLVRFPRALIVPTFTFRSACSIGPWAHCAQALWSGRRQREAGPGPWIKHGPSVGP